VRKSRSTKHYILEALIPYTDSNLKLTFKPSRFFTELERANQINTNTLRNSYRRAVEQGFIDHVDSRPKLTDKGKLEIMPFISKKLPGSKLMVTFDIPEEERHKRSALRNILYFLSFKQIQKSVWVSSYDHREYLKQQFKILELESYVHMYEAREL
jgi:DNA-binding transcriptional regulator PaaX